MKLITLIPILLILCGIIAVVYYFLSGEEEAGLDRVNRFVNQVEQEKDNNSEKEDTNSQGKEFLDKIRVVLQDSLLSRVNKTNYGQNLTKKLSHAGLQIRSEEWIGLSILISAILGIVLTLVGKTVLFTFVGIAMGFFGMQFILNHLVKKRQKAFNKQLGTLVKTLSNWLKSGHALRSAIVQVSNNIGEPAKGELQRFAKELELGMPLNEACTNFLDRNPSEDVKLLVLAFQIQNEMGGNLSEILESIAETIKTRIKIQDEVKTLTAQATISGYIVMFLPFGLAGILEVINPKYIDRLFTTGLGHVILIIAGVMMTIGYFIIKKISKIKV